MQGESVVEDEKLNRDLRCKDDEGNIIVETISSLMLSPEQAVDFRRPSGRSGRSGWS
jgi:hypothetical protein